MPEAMPEHTPQALTSQLRVIKHGGVHFLLWIVAMGLFAAADSWHHVTGLGLASFLCVITAIVAGLTTTTLLHEWFHFLGARISRSSYEIPSKAGLFVLDWNYSNNSLKQFYTMSVAGSVGSVVGVALLWWSVPTDTDGRDALVAASLASLAFAAAVEWPVLLRTRISGDPFTELSKIDQGVLLRSFLIATVAGWLCWLAL